MPAFSSSGKLVPSPNSSFRFERSITLSILAGLVYNKRVLIVGGHGIGKSAHIEQVCSRLNWPCVRLNMDSFATRLELIGRDAIAIRRDIPVVKFKYGLLPWALRRPVVLVLDDYDACKPETGFVFNKVLEARGELVIPENNKLLKPNASFRMLATCNTLTGAYVGTFKANEAQLDRWGLVFKATCMSFDDELRLVKCLLGNLNQCNWGAVKIVKLAQALRALRRRKKTQTLLTTRGIISWIELSQIFNSIEKGFRYAHLNKCIRFERKAVKRCFQRTFGIAIS
ncbi:MAG: AAA family ATPase [Candidatus Hodgkinia cicadicola]